MNNNQMYVHDSEKHTLKQNQGISRENIESGFASLWESRFKIILHSLKCPLGTPHTERT